MEQFDEIIKLVDANLIFCLVPIILTLMLVEFLFKKRFETKKVLNLIRWTIIVYTLIAFLHFIIGLIQFPDKFSFIDRATGPYKIAYWLMFLSALILPFTLLIRKFASRFWYVLWVAILIKAGFYFERFVIIVTSYHRDYIPGNGNFEVKSMFFTGFATLFLQGFIIAILALGMIEVLKKKPIDF